MKPRSRPFASAAPVMRKGQRSIARRTKRKLNVLHSGLRSQLVLQVAFVDPRANLVHLGLVERVLHESRHRTSGRHVAHARRCEVTRDVDAGDAAEHVLSKSSDGRCVMNSLFRITVLLFHRFKSLGPFAAARRRRRRMMRDLKRRRRNTVQDP